MHLIVDQGDAFSLPAHRATDSFWAVVYRGCGPRVGSLGLNRRMRVQLSPALTWGCRLSGKDRWLSISGCGIVPRRPYQFFGSYFAGGVLAF